MSLENVVDLTSTKGMLKTTFLRRCGESFASDFQCVRWLLRNLGDLLTPLG